MNGKVELPSDALTFRDLSFGAIRRWRLVLVGALGLVGLGALAWVFIPRLEEPRIDVPGMSVTIVYPGASPEDVEIQVVKPVEEVLYELPDIEWVEARALPSVASFAIRFTPGVDMDVMAEKARGKVMGKKNDLPAEVKEPRVVAWTTANIPQMVIAVTGHTADLTLSAAARRLKTMLMAVPGVASVTLRGEHKQAVRVRLDPVRLARHHLSADDVVRQLRYSNVRIPGGDFEIGSLSALLQINNELPSAAAVAKVPVGAAHDRTGGTRSLSLGDVAEVSDATLTAHERFAYNAEPAVGLELRFRKGTDAITVGGAVRAEIKTFEPLLPPGTRTVVCQDQPAWITTSVSGFIESLLEGMALVLVVITLGMGWRAALVVSGVIPLAIGGAVLGLYLLGFSLETVTIGGLIVAIGLLVDDAVVVTESVQIMRAKGLSSLRAAVFGTARVFWANNGTTAVAISSFLPLFAMGGDTGEYVKGLPTAVILALVTSLAVAQLFTPWVATFFIKKPAEVADIGDATAYDRRDDRSTGPHVERNPALLFLRRLYGRVVPIIVARPGWVVSTFVLLLSGALLLFPLIGFQFFPKADKGVLFASVELPKGTRLERVSEKLVEATQILRRDPAVAESSAVVGGVYPAVFSSRMGPATGGNVADILVGLKPGADSTRTAERLRGALGEIAGVRVVVDELSFGPPVPHPVLVRIYGDDHLLLRSIAEEVKRELRTIPGAINISDSLTESVPLASVKLDADRALRRGVTPAQVGQTLRWLHGEDKVTEFRRGEDLVEVVLDHKPAPDRPFEALLETPIPAATQAMVPLKEAGQAELTYGFAKLSRRNTRRVVEVWADVSGDTLASGVTGRLDRWLRARHWEPGYGFFYGGEQEETAESFRKLGVAAVGAIILVFMLLLLMFDNLLLSLLVVMAVPFALIGALPGLALTGNAFGFMAFLGLIALIGVYVNHKIYFVDRMLELMRRGDNLPDAILHAGQDRLRPVVLTALTAVLGLLPLTLGGVRMWNSFGWVNIFGLVASIPLSLVLLPSLIVLSLRITRRLRGRRASALSGGLS
jgi:multidrug efflux pump subunit AcrB